MANNIRGGIAYLQVDGKLLELKGNWTYNFGFPKRTPIVGTSTVHGFSEKPQPPFLEGAITDSAGLSASELMNIRDATITLKLANGKTGVWRNGWWAGDGNITTEEGEIAARFEARTAEEVTA